MAAHLMTTRRFAPLFWCQFFSAFNDNFLKSALSILIVFKLGENHSGALLQLAGATFIGPYFFFSGLGGQLADRLDKAVVARWLKLVEIAVAAIAVAGFATHSIPLLFVALGLFGTIGALFGPIKYGILPAHPQPEELPAGNALVEGATFLAILFGTIVGIQAAKGGGNPAAFGALIMVMAALCWGASILIPRTGQAAPGLAINANILKSTASLVGHLRTDPRLWWGGLVASWFWLVGAVVVSWLPTLVKDVLGGNEDVINAYLAVFSIAIAVGSGLASWLAHGRIILLPTLFGAVLLALFAIDLGVTTSGAPALAGTLDIVTMWKSSKALHVAVDLAGLAIG